MQRENGPRLRMANTAGVERKDLPREQSGDGQLDSVADAERQCCRDYDHPAPAALMRTQRQNDSSQFFKSNFLKW